MPLAPERFVEWMTNNKDVDRKLGQVYRYHSRSDSHSKAICLFILDDLIQVCTTLKEHAAVGKVVYKINLPYLWANSAKAKTIDLAIGLSIEGVASNPPGDPIVEGMIGRVLLSMEAKSVMTEHGKSQPRLYDELSSSHTIVHAGDDTAIAAGITVVNIADRFVSPLRQKIANKPLEWTIHKQPHAAERMVKHLRGLPIRSELGEKGFDAYTTIVISCDNQNAATLWTAPPTPQPGDRDHYATFLQAIAKAYDERFSSL
jgi:hypothetical protein